MPSYDPSPKFKVKLKCRDCGHKYSRILRSLDDEDPDCPRCLTAARPPRGLKLNGQAPSMGGSNLAKAHDFAESEAARQSSFTNLRTPRRPGDVMSPALPVAQQAQADSFFVQGAKVRAANPQLAARTSAATAAVNSGAFANNADAKFVSGALAARIKPNIHYINQPPQRLRNGK